MTREEHNKLIDKLEQLRFFNQRAGRELWGDKPREIQDEDIKNADATLDMAISALSENMHGEWIYDGDQIICSKCRTAFNFISLKVATKFCAECGADMRGKEHE